MLSAELSAFNYLLNIEQVAYIASRVGRIDVHSEMSALAQSVRSDFTSAFYANGTYVSGLQGEIALPLFLQNVNSASEYHTLLDSLVHDISVTHKGHFTTGISSTKFMMQALPMWGKASVALEIAEKNDYPSCTSCLVGKSLRSLSVRLCLFVF